VVVFYKNPVLKMRVAILTRPGACFPNLISLGLSDMLRQLEIEHKIFDDAIPFLMRLLPFSEQPKRWANNFHFRVYNKLKYRKQDNQLLSELKKFDLIILSECLPNAFWKNYLAIETLKTKLNSKPIFSYTDAFIKNAPLHQKMWFDGDDYGADRFNVNLCPSPVTEIRNKPSANWKAIGVNISISGLKPIIKKEFIAVVDFAQKGYELYREQQLVVLSKLGIKTIVLEGRYPIEEIRKIYQQASVFFLAFPETFGLPIAECLASGTCIFTPNSGWPMAWRLDEKPMPWGTGSLPNCFKVYQNEEELEQQLLMLRQQFDGEKTPLQVFDTFIKHYSDFYYGNLDALKEILLQYN
jgi:hypothetical protein